MNKQLIQGSGGGGKGGGGGSARAPVEAADSLQSAQYAKILDLIAEGEIYGLVDGLKSIYLDDTPLQNPDGSYNFSGVTWDERTGTQTQLPVAGFDSSEAESPVGLEITAANSVTKTIDGANNTAVRITLSVPSLTQQNTSTGDINATSVAIAIDIQNNGGGFIAAALRKIYTTNNFNLTAIGAVTGVASSAFYVAVSWVGEAAKAPQTLTMQLQYRQLGSPTWLTYTSFSFSGGSYASVNDSPVTWFGNTGSPGSIGSGSKTFNLNLPHAQYEFRALKISGSISYAASRQMWSYYSGGTYTGMQYGGSVSIVSGEIYQPVNSDIISGKTSSKYQRAYRIELPSPGPWDIRVRRLTADSTSVALQNKTFWDSYTEIIDARLGYPNSALQALRIDSKQFTNIPVRGYEAKGILVKIPSNYNPLTRAYSGIWDGTFSIDWTDNPAWAFYDIIANARYGLGEFVSEDSIDKWALYEIAQYCDEMVDDGFGGIEPRFTASIYIQTQEEAYKVIGNIASIFRGMAYWASGSITASQDAPKDASALFNQANIVGGMFSYSGSSARVRHTVALVAWNDPADAYHQKIEYVEDSAGIARYGVIKTDLVAIGCTSRGQASRMGRWLIYSEQNETETITFRAAMDAVYVSPGDIIKTHDTNRAGARFGGRIIDATLSSITLDAPVTLDTGINYELSCVLTDGSIEVRAITNAAGVHSNITLSADLSDVPQQYAIWLINGANLNLEQWRVVSIAEVDKTQLDITALAYRPEKYAVVEDGLILQPLPVSLINTGQPLAPAGLTIAESLYMAGLGVVGVKALFSWESVAGVARYTAIYQKLNEAPVIIENILTTSYEITALTEGNYTFSVYCTNALGRRSKTSSLEFEILGKTIAPNDIADFVLSSLGSLGLFGWSPSTDLDVIVGGKVLFRFSPDINSQWDSAAALSTQTPGAGSTQTLPLQSGIYFAKFEDSSGNQSTNATSIITDAASVQQLNFLSLIASQPDWLGEKFNTQYSPDLQALVLTSSELWDSSELIDAIDDVDFGGGVNLSGSYAVGALDIGSVQTSRVSGMVESFGIDLVDTWDSDELIDSIDAIDGAVVSDVSAIMYARYTNDNPAISAIWTPWQPLVLEDINARAYEFELRLTSGNTFHNVVVRRAEAQVDMPDRIETGNDISSGMAMHTIIYSKAFQVTPALSITAQNMATGDYYALSNKTAAGFTLEFKNAAGTNINRTFDYIAKAF
jgi:predicted phage tail protein